ncbi:MAG: hypothetical protein ACRC7O_04970 [Fimbriiglobus sp.]
MSEDPEADSDRESVSADDPPGGLFPRLGFSVNLLVIQAIVWLVASLNLDSGVLSRACSNVFIGYWVGVGLIVIRRCDRVEASDRWFVRWGWLLLLVYGVNGAYAYWRSVGAI